MNNNGHYVGGHNTIYHSSEGISVHSAGTTEVGWELEQNIIAECVVGIIMRSGSRNHMLARSQLRTTWISALVLENAHLDENGKSLIHTTARAKNFNCSNSFGA